ncbi:MAG: hypothetical protein FWD92_06745 [Methanomassiliicoccaceae archaeon]|nr:hypothetical protein [Methanomassiliicoccaceae archaeon]
MACLVFGNERVDVAAGVTIEDAMIALGKHPDSFLFLLNGKPIPVTTVLDHEHVINALRVASGG